MNLEVAAEDTGASSVLQELLKRFVASGEAARPVRLDAKRVPQFGPKARPGEADRTWEALQTMQNSGLIKIDDVRVPPRKAPWEMAQLVRLIPSEARRAASLIGFAIDRDPWDQEWIAACNSATWLPEAARRSLATRPHRLGTRTPTDVLAAWRRMVSPELKAVYLREAASAAFWGISKALDGRLTIVNILRDAAGLAPLLEAPIAINVHLASGGLDVGVLFIENQATFEAARRARISATAGLDLVYSEGFKASAARLRKEETSSLYFSDSSDLGELTRFRRWLYSGTHSVPTYFWGDLDFAAMGILKALRRVFHNTQAWRPGYEGLLGLLRQGLGHAATEDTRKGEQRRIGETGCTFADSELIPAIEQTGHFADQEALFS